MMKTQQRARRPARTRSPPTKPTIRIMGGSAEVEAVLLRLAAAGFVEVGRARLRDDPAGVRVYGVLADQPTGEDG